MNITVDEVFEYLAKRGVVGGTPLLSEGEKKKERIKTQDIQHPEMGLSEDWGDPTTEKGEIMRQYSAQIPGNTMPEKLASLNEFIAGKASTIGEIMSTTVYIDCLHALMVELSASPAGFMFESYLAALMHGVQVKLSSGPVALADVIKRTSSGKEKVNVEATAKIIEIPFSMKLLSGGGAATVKGSRQLLYRALLRNKFIIYIVGIKDKDKSGVTFYDFKIDRSELEKSLGMSIQDYFLIYYKNNMADTPEKQALVDENPEVIIQDFVAGKLKTGPMDSFSFTFKSYKDAGPLMSGKMNWGMSQGEIGHLGVDEKTLRKMAEQYTGTLNDGYDIIWKAFNTLSVNLNNYFLDSNSKEGMQAGMAANENAKILKVETDKVVASGKQMELGL